METATRAMPRTPDPRSWTALGRDAIVVALPRVGTLRVTGPDRVAFLNGQLANDVARLEAGGALRSAYLDVRGHALAEMRVQRREQDLQLAVEDGAVRDVARRLLAHRVFDQVEVAELAGEISTLTVQGPSAADLVSDLLHLGPWREGRFETARFGDAEILVLRNRRSLPGGVDLHLPSGALEKVARALEAAGATGGDEATLEASRIEAGLPRAGTEAGPGVLPQEAGLEETFSTRKGCYLGQEVMARVEARARLRRSLVRLRLEAAAPGVAPGAEIVAAGRTVGRLGSVAIHPELGCLALALLRDDVTAGTTLQAGPVGAAILAP